MKEDEYGPCNIIIQLEYPQSTAKRRRVSSQEQLTLPVDQNARKKPPCNHRSQSSISGFEEYYEEKGKNEQQTRQWLCHTQILYKESPYFAALFGDGFIESAAKTVSLPANIITTDALESILLYMYTHQLQQPQNTANIVRDLTDIYLAADYLLMEHLCDYIAQALFEQVVHKCICYCTGCAINVPKLLLFCILHGPQDLRIISLTQKLVHILTNDPEKCLSAFWASRHMSKLLMVQQYDEISKLSQKVLVRVNKSNAIESLYACFNASNTLSTHDPLLSWSKPLHSTLTSVQSTATRIIATHFDFFCSQYPALLSCIDGITYSFGFLEYLLLHILEDQMDCDNVGILYKGICIDLMSRHAVQYNMQVKHILSVAKVMVLYYITRKINDIRSKGGLDKLNKYMLKALAEDLDVKPKSLLSSKHALSSNSQHSVFSFLMPSMPNLSLSASTPTQYTYERLSRYPSRSTTASTTYIAHSPTKLFLFAKRLNRLFKRLSSNPAYHYESIISPLSSPSFQQQQIKMPSRYVSTNTVETMSSTSSSWLREVQFLNQQLGTSMPTSSQRKRRNRCLPCCTDVSSSQEVMSVPVIGINRRVQLSRRPTLTVGTVLFIGHVNFADGLWIGVELDRRVGKNDGSVNGDRYFTSSPNRGVFVRPEDVSIVV